MGYRDERIRRSYTRSGNYRNVSNGNNGDRNSNNRRNTLRMRRRRARQIKMLAAAAIVLVALLGVLGIFKAVKGKKASAASTQKVKKEETLEDFIKKNDLTMEDYPQELLELLDRNPEAKEFVWEYPLKKNEHPEIDLSEYANTQEMPLLMQWDERWGYKEYSGNVMGLTGCGPTCLSMVAMYLSKDTSRDPGWMADFSTENGYAAEGSGTAWALFSEGGEKLGFDVTEIPLDEQRIADNLNVGNPVVAVMGPGAFTTDGHFIVFTGYEDGKIRVNDPNSRANTEKSWDFEEISGQIKQLWVFRK